MSDKHPFSGFPTATQIVAYITLAAVTVFAAGITLLLAGLLWQAIAWAWSA